MEVHLDKGQVKKGLSSESLKIIAIVAMFIDHAAFLVRSDYYSPLAACLHFIGRITGPLMLFFITEGYHHTSNVSRYTKRLAVFALVSYFPFILFVNNGLPTSLNGWLRFNVIYTLLLGLLALRARHEVKNPVTSVCLVGLCILASVFGDWSYIGVIAILLFDLLRSSLINQRIGFSLLVLLCAIMPPLEAVLTGYAQEDELMYLTAVGISLGMLIPMFLLGRYNGQRRHGSKWLFYVFYPAHLLLLFFVARWLGITVNV